MMVCVTRFGVTSLIWGEKIHFQVDVRHALKRPFSDHFDDMTSGQDETVPSWFLPCERVGSAGPFFFGNGLRVPDQLSGKAPPSAVRSAV